MTTTNSNSIGPSCPSEEDIVSYVRDELQPSERDKVRRHLEECSDCIAIMQDYCHAIQMLGMATEIPVNANLLSRIWDEISKSDRAHHQLTDYKKSIPFPRILVQTAACLAVLLGITYTALFRNNVPGNKDPDGSKQSEYFATAYEQDLALTNSLKWLIKAQDESGKWSPNAWGGRREYTIGLTGMALLSLARNHDDAPERHESISRAVQYLLKKQGEDGCFGDEFDGTMYNHAISTVALLNVYRYKQDAKLKASLKRAIAFIVNQQLPSGGWGYRNQDGEAANTSISVWPFQALLLSSQEGFEDSNTALHRCVTWLVGVVDETGQFGYQRPHHFPNGPDALTAMGAYSLIRAADNS